MLKISSRDNERIKFLRKLGQKKFRDEEACFLVENLVIIYDALRAGFFPDSFFVTSDYLRKNDRRLDFIVQKSSGNYFVIDEQINKVFSSLDTAPGLAAVFTRPKSQLNLDDHIIYLNGISDPGNLGTIFRTALAFGFKNIVVDENCADVYGPKTIQAAKDAIFKLNIVHDKKLSVFKQISDKMNIYSTQMEGGVRISDIDKSSIFCLVLGNESNGVAEEIISKTNKFIAIPMSGEIESLNVAISAGIILHSLSDF